MHWLLLIPVIPYLLILLRLYRKQPAGESATEPGNPSKNVTVIIPCRDEAERLPHILGDLAGQDIDKSLFEVIVSDDHSSDGTETVAAEWASKLRIRVVKPAEKGKKAAIECAVKASSTELIITTDADCRAGKSWLRTAILKYTESNPEMIIMPVRLEPKREFFSSLQRLEFLSLQGITAASAALSDPVMCNGANLAFTKSAYLRNHTLLHQSIESGDDIFLLHALKRESSPIAWLNSQQATVFTEPAKGIRNFLKQRARWISKAGSFSDRFTNITAIVTFVTIANLLYLSITGFVNPKHMDMYFAALALKSVPDFLILRRAAKLHSEEKLLWWFIPAQLLYQWYVLAVLVRSLFENRWKN